MSKTTRIYIEGLEAIERAARRVCIAQLTDPEAVPGAIYELSQTIDAHVDAVKRRLDQETMERVAEGARNYRRYLQSPDRTEA